MTVTSAAVERRAPLVSVVVPCRRPARIADIAAALACSDVACELLVAGDVAELDAGSWPVPGVALVEPDPHPNVRRCRALARASGDVLAFLDDDAVPEPGWLSAAAALEPSSVVIWTGPERPVRSGSVPDLAHAVARTGFGEGTTAHVSAADGRRHWAEVPFCNLVTTRAVLRLAGWPSVDVPGDIDDFEFCHRAAAAGVPFRNRPDLAIRHDRYPDTLRGWLVGRARDRHVTGVNLVLHPHLYLRIPGVAAVSLAPLVAAVAWRTTHGRRRAPMVAAAAAAYAAVVTVTARRAAEPGMAVGRIAAGVVALHTASLPAFAAGVLAGVRRRVARSR